MLKKIQYSIFSDGTIQKRADRLQVAWVVALSAMILCIMIDPLFFFTSQNDLGEFSRLVKVALWVATQFAILELWELEKRISYEPDGLQRVIMRFPIEKREQAGRITRLVFSPRVSILFLVLSMLGYIALLYFFTDLPVIMYYIAPLSLAALKTCGVLWISCKQE